MENTHSLYTDVGTIKLRSVKPNDLEIILQLSDDTIIISPFAARALANMILDIIDGNPETGE